MVVAEGQRQSVQRILEAGSVRELQTVADQFQHHEQLAGAAVYDPEGKPLAVTSAVAQRLEGTPTAVIESLRTRKARGQFFRLSGMPAYVLALPVDTGTSLLWAIAIFHNAGYTVTPILRHVLTSVAFPRSFAVSNGSWSNIRSTREN